MMWGLMEEGEAKRLTTIPPALVGLLRGLVNVEGLLCCVRNGN